MEVTIRQAAARLGRSPRQIRYLIQKARIPARKVGGRWLVTISAAEQSTGQARAAAQKVEKLRAVVESALSLPPPRRRYSITDLKAFQIAQS